MSIKSSADIFIEKELHHICTYTSLEETIPSLFKWQAHSTVNGWPQPPLQQTDHNYQLIQTPCSIKPSI